MSTLRTVNIQHPDSSTPAITLNSAGSMSGSFPSPNRNLLYNGAMQIFQRSSSATGINTNGFYGTADRWRFAATNGSIGVWTQTIENDAPSGSGFRNSLRMLCTTASNPPTSNFRIAIGQELEGFDVQRLAKGTSSAQQLSLSFWVKSNVTGTYTVELIDRDNNRSVSGSYTILSSGTWERKSITLPADTVGVLDNDNNSSLACTFCLSAGSDFTSGTLQTSWGSVVNANRSVGQTNLASATNNYWQITGVQLETGPVATPFEFKSYGQELRECQRYFERISVTGQSGVSNFSGMCTGTGSALFVIEGKSHKRNTPTSSSISAAGTFSVVTSNGGLTGPATGASIVNYSQHGIVVSLSGMSGLTAGNAAILYGVTGQTIVIDINAEL